MKSHRKQLLFWSALTVIILAVLFTSMSSIHIVHSLDEPTSIYTRFATPLSSPVNNGGHATWTVKQMALASKYPKGFDFVLDASSDAGKITIAKVNWRHSTGKPISLMVFPDQSGKYVGHWAPNIYQDLPQWVGIDYWWTLTDEHGNVFETEHGYSEYVDNTRKWKRLVSEDAVIHWEASLPADVGPQIAAALKDHREKYQQAWGKLLNYKPHIIIYASYKPWQEWSPAIDPTTLEGETSPYWGATIQIYHSEMKDATKYLAFGVVLHEVEHLYQQTFTPFDTYLKQVWFFEGDASYMEEYPQYDYVKRVKAMAAAGTLPFLQKEAALRMQDDPRLAYDVGCAVWQYVEATYGPDMHRKIWETVRKGIPIDQAIKLATGDDFAVMEKGFRKWLGASN
jgi:hypothetical protein